MKCLVCNSQMEADNRKGLVRCSKCGFVSADLALSYEELEDIYAEDYFKEGVYTDYPSDALLHKRNFKRRLARIKKHIRNISDATVLEIGCAYGFFLDACIDEGIHSLQGIDISKDAIQFTKKKLTGLADVYQGDYLSFPVSERRYDIICLWDTIEHLSRPDEYIRKAAQEIKSGGLLCLTTGDIDSLNAKLRGSKWRQIHPPEHLHYFSKKTLALLLEKNGFMPIDITYVGNEISMRDVAHAICANIGKDSLWTRIRDWKIMNMSIYFFLHDYIFVIGRKR